MENKQSLGDFLTRLPCMIYDPERSEDKGSIDVIWPYSPDLLSSHCSDLELEFHTQLWEDPSLA